MVSTIKRSICLLLYVNDDLLRARTDFRIVTSPSILYHSIKGKATWSINEFVYWKDSNSSHILRHTSIDLRLPNLVGSGFPFLPLQRILITSTIPIAMHGPLSCNEFNCVPSKRTWQTCRSAHWRLTMGCWLLAHKKAWVSCPPEPWWSNMFSTFQNILPIILATNNWWVQSKCRGGNKRELDECAVYGRVCWDDCCLTSSEKAELCTVYFGVVQIRAMGWTQSAEQTSRWQDSTTVSSTNTLFDYQGFSRAAKLY